MFNVQIDFDTIRERLYDFVDELISFGEEATEIVNESAQQLYDYE